MKKCLYLFLIFLSLVSSAFGQEQEKRNLRQVVSSNATTTITPDLWGLNGANWDPVNSLLRDFTDVGYNLSNSAIPDSWPIYMNVTTLTDANDELWQHFSTPSITVLIFTPSESPMDVTLSMDHSTSHVTTVSFVVKVGMELYFTFLNILTRF